MKYLSIAILASIIASPKERRSEAHSSSTGITQLATPFYSTGTNEDKLADLMQNLDS